MIGGETVRLDALKMMIVFDGPDAKIDLTLRDFFLVRVYHRQNVLPSYSPNPERMKTSNNRSFAVHNPEQSKEFPV